MSEATSEEFGRRVRMAMASANMSCRDVGAVCGVSAQAVSQWMRGHCYPRSNQLLALAKATGAPIDWLMSSDDPFPVNFAAERRRHDAARDAVERALTELRHGHVYEETIQAVKALAAAYDKLRMQDNAHDGT
jgi:transcriptional regulator with XRE-family HTH domain